MKKQTFKKCFTLFAIATFFNFNLYSQGTTWNLSGNNNGTSTTFVGTTTSQPLIFKTNNTERFRISQTGQFTFSGLGTTGTGFLTTNSSGQLQRTIFTGNSNQVLLGNGTFGTLPSSSYFTLNGTNQLYTPYKLGVGIVYPTEMLEVNGNGVFNGTVTTQGIIIADVAMARDRLMFQNNGMLMEGFNPIDGTRNDIAAISQPLYINSMTTMSQNTIINNGNIGNVGIGTSSPMGKLDVNGLAYFQSDLMLPNISPTNTIDASTVLVLNASGKVEKTSIDNIVKSSYKPSPTNPVSCSPAYLAAPTWFNGPMKIYSECPDVKVGIGTSVPSHSLTVNGNSLISSSLTVNTEVNVGNNVSIGGNDALNASRLFIVNPNRQSGIVIKQNNNPELYQKLLYFEYTEPTAEVLNVRNTANNYSPIIVRADGSIDIDNGTRKIFKLHAGGILQTREVWVDANNWPDYVFTPSYNLKPLSEVKTFIQTNGHLPNVPSAEEVKEKGVNLAENDKVLLEKVEELTLYLIQLEERLAEQEKTIQILQNGQSVKQSTDKK